MNADKERLKMLLTETISLLCQRGLTFSHELHVQGLLGITVDGDVFLVSVNEKTSSVKPPQYVSRETEASRFCDSNPQQHGPAIEQTVAMSEVRNIEDKPMSTSSQAVLSRYPAVIDKPSLCTPVKTETLYLEIDGSDDDDETQVMSNRSNEDVYRSESVTEPVEFEHPFLTSAPGFGNSMTVAQVHATADGVKYECKRKRKPNRFSDDMLILSSDNDEWTNSSQREVDLPQPVAGCSQWSSFGEESLHHGASVDLGQKGRRRRTEYDSKQFVCQYEDCDKAFFRKDHLIRHQRQKHGKPFGVDSQLIYYCYDGNCGKTFYNVASLRRHMIMIHNYAAADEPLE